MEEAVRSRKPTLINAVIDGEVPLICRLFIPASNFTQKGDFVSS